MEQSIEQSRCAHGMLPRQCKMCKDQQSTRGVVIRRPFPSRQKIAEDGDGNGVTETSVAVLEVPKRRKKHIPKRNGPILPSVLSSEELKEKERLGVISDAVIDVPVSRIRPFSEQPREFFDEGKLHRLARSLRQFGQVQPIQVKWLYGDPRFYCEIIDGERRWRAARIAKLPILQVLIVQVADKKEQFQRSFISNFEGEGHTPLEVANAIIRLVEDGWKISQIAAAFGRSQQWVHTRRKVASLAPEVQDLMDPSLSSKHRLKIMVALMLVSLPDHLQIALANEVIKKGMSINPARQYIRARALEEGFTAGDAERSPSEDFNNLESSNRLIGNRFDLLIAMRLNQVAAMFEHRDPDDFDRVLKDFEELSAKIEVIRTRLLAALEREVAE